MMTYVYLLRHPQTKEIRYVGKSNNLKRRYKQHVTSRLFYSTHVCKWIGKVVSQGLRPEMVVLECAEGSGALEEQEWIGYFKFLGARLGNHTQGGEGVVGLKHSEATRKLLSQKLKGKLGNRKGVKLPQESKDRMRLAKEYKMRPIMVWRDDCPEIWKFESIKAAERSLKLSSGSLRHVLKGAYKQVRGYRVSFITKEHLNAVN